MKRGLLAAFLAAVVFTAVPAPAAPAAAENHAALVIDTGAEIRTVCVGFSTDSITGKQLLERAGVDPVFGSYGGQGTAVCALCGVGCPSSDCLTCDSRNYWAYHRAAAGASKFSYSAAGSGSTTVRNGDVDGWRWGSGTAPAFQSFESICGSPEPPPTEPPTTAAPATTSAPATTTGSAAPTTASSSATVGESTTTTTAAGTTSSSSMTTTTRRTDDEEDDEDEADEVSGEETAAVRTDEPGSSGGWGSAAGFGVALALVCGLGLWARRRRRSRA